MDDSESLARIFEAHRERLRLISYRMLGSLGEADDAVQETWLRLSRTGGEEIDDLPAWLTTVASRQCLNMLQSRSRRREDFMADHRLVAISAPVDGLDPAEEVVLADSVGHALVLVMDRLSPAERLSFVLHDMFAVPFDQIGAVLGRSDVAVRQLASRARRRVRDGGALTVQDRLGQRAIVDAFFAAARGGDLTGLIAALHPDVVLRTDQAAGTGASTIVRGAREVADRALLFAGPQRQLRPALVNGAVGVLVTVEGRLVSIMRFTVRDDAITIIEAFTDPHRLDRLDPRNDL